MYVGVPGFDTLCLGFRVLAAVPGTVAAVGLKGFGIEHPKPPKP